jgi:D-glycero-alpha-D-manno-heptose-7-phosphate kinase
MVKALSELFQIKLGKAQIVEDSAHIERNICGFEGGMQDYISAVYGGLNNTKFYRDGSYFVQPIRLSQDDIAIFEQSCFLVSSGASRFSGEIIRHQSQSLSSKVRLNAMHDVKKSAGNITRHLINSDYEKFFHEMALSWEAKKRTSSKIVNPEIRRLEKLVMDNGGSAIKVSGAGGGGFIQVFAKPEESLYLRALLERSWEIRNVSLIETGTRAWMAE